MATRTWYINETHQHVCFNLPPNVNSKGYQYHVLNDPKFGLWNWLNSSMPRFEVMALFILIVSNLFHSVLKRLGFPVFLSQLIAGRLLAGLLTYNIKGDEDKKKSIEESLQILGTIATIGYAASVFQTGVKVDLGMIGRAGKKSIFIGCFSVIVSFLSGVVASQLLIEDVNKANKNFYESFHAVTTCITSFPVITSLLNDLKIVNSELGRIGQSAALISDILSMVLINCMIVTTLFMEKNGNPAALWWHLGLIIGFLFIIVFIIRPTMKRIVRNIPPNGRVKDVYVYGIICIFLGLTSLSRWFPQFVMAPYILGLAVPTGPPLGSVIAEKFDGLTSGLFMPLFVATCGMRKDFVNIGVLEGSRIVQYSIVICLIFLAKFGTSFAILLNARFPKSDGCALALIMCGKGFMEMAALNFLSDNKLLSDGLFCLLSLAVVIIASFMPILVKLLYDPSRRYTAYERRTIMHLAPNSNMQILTCIHVPNHISAVTNLLEASGASGERPIGVHVLHLIKLSGQAAPVFISHDKRKIGFSDSYSENVILSFTKFESNNWGALSVNVFTSVSTPNLVYEDVCTLALDKSASLIVLPFHLRWYHDGSVESDDNSTRVLNQMVLDRAPCSVGILVDRGYNKRRLIPTELSRELTQNVAMIFLGGNDDREALVYAMRMAEDPNVILTVERLMSPNEDTTSYAKVLDSELLKDVVSLRHIRYIEHEVNEGPDTAAIIRSMMKEFNLFIVGRAESLKRQQTVGLDEWVDYPELGVIGDMFAGSNVEEKFLVLVVQQQRLTIS